MAQEFKQPKFSIGQQVWFMADNMPHSGIIVEIKVKADCKYKADYYNYNPDVVEICYTITDELESVCESDRVYEPDVFGTEEELCKAVFSRVFENAKITQ